MSMNIQKQLWVNWTYQLQMKWKPKLNEAEWDAWSVQINNIKKKRKKRIIVSSILSDKLILQLRFMDINDTEQEALNLVM